MREKVEKFEREYRGDRTNMFEDSPNAFKAITLTNIIGGQLVDGEPVVEQDENAEYSRIIVKDKGVLKELAIVNNEIKLKEIDDG